MKFHPGKCNFIRISTNSKSKKETYYKLHGHTLETVPTSKYLGVNFSEDLQWKHHVDVTAKIASKSIGFLRRNLRECRKNVRNAAYISLVRPTLENASAAWDPHTTEDINRIEQVQRRAARFVTNNYTDETHGCVTNMVKTQEWEQLTNRRSNHRLVMLYKIQHMS
ncbi:uncharacterized protein [Mytilus edulis]|uniref:uncharacterized protein n=1 Tax=Mytilus edulis TaxID=6550 RepID=UPI0039EE553A